MAQLFANAARSTLTASITSSSTQLQINPADQALFPVATGVDWFKVALEDSSGNLEYLRVQRAVGQSLLTITERATEDATKFPARSFVAGSLVELRMTAADLAASIAHPSVGTGAHAAAAISVTPAGGISAATVQAALQELDTEKANAADVTPALAGKASLGANTFTGAQTLPGNASNALEAVPKQQLDSGLETRALLAGLASQKFSVAYATTSDHAVALGQFGSLLAANGYQRLPSGLILQWGATVGYQPPSGVGASFPIPFPNQCFHVSGSWSGGPAAALMSMSFNVNGWSGYVDEWVGANNFGQVFWFAIGF